MAVTQARGDGRTERPARGRPRRPGVTEAILEATVALAAEGGLEDVTLDMIAGRVGVGLHTIYRRWPSKEALLQAAFERIVSNIWPDLDCGNVRDDLIAWARG